MRLFSLGGIVIGLAVGWAALPGHAEAQKKDDPELAKKVYKIFEQSCFVCHGPKAPEGGFGYILEHKELVTTKVVPGKADKSRLFKRMGIAKDMPPTAAEDSRAKGLPRPSEADIALVKAWIDAGAPPWILEDIKPRTPVLLVDELKAMRDYLRKTERADRSYQRFFTFRHLHNTPPSQVKDADLRLNQAALSKLINSLSWKHAIVLPRTVDAAGTVFAIDVRQLDWDRHQLWNEIVKVYPYGLQHLRYPDDKAVNDLADEIYELAGTTLPAVRADWFIATASRPPLYHKLLQLPDNAYDLETKLRVNVTDNFMRGQLARAGFNGSGVSGQTRLVERHEALYGAYWKSYDFKTSGGRGNLFVLPLGPPFAGNPFVRHAFRQDGGEIIFNLPNGLQGYLLVDGKDKRIDAGPVEVVSDSKKTSGTPLVVNGLSCMACHQHGMIEDFKDAVRDGHILGGQARDKVRELYATGEEMKKLLVQDKERFLRASDKAMAPFLRVGPDAKKDITDFPEPISLIARWYLVQDLKVEDAAVELRISPQKLQGAIDANPRLRELGLSPLAKNTSIKLEVWENLDFILSAYQEAARELKLGNPVNP